LITISPALAAPTVTSSAATTAANNFISEHSLGFKGRAQGAQARKFVTRHGSSCIDLNQMGSSGARSCIDLDQMGSSGTESSPTSISFQNDRCDLHLNRSRSILSPGSRKPRGPHRHQPRHLPSKLPRGWRRYRPALAETCAVERSARPRKWGAWAREATVGGKARERGSAPLPASSDHASLPQKSLPACPESASIIGLFRRVGQKNTQVTEFNEQVLPSEKLTRFKNHYCGRPNSAWKNTRSLNGIAALRRGRWRRGVSMAAARAWFRGGWLSRYRCGMAFA
jgi:hypothetical protein